MSSADKWLERAYRLRYARRLAIFGTFVPLLGLVPVAMGPTGLVFVAFIPMLFAASVINAMLWRYLRRCIEHDVEPVSHPVGTVDPTEPNRGTTHSAAGALPGRRPRE